MTPLTPSKIGCKPSVYPSFDTLARLNIKNPSKQNCSLALHLEYLTTVTIGDRY